MIRHALRHVPVFCAALLLAPAPHARAQATPPAETPLPPERHDIPDQQEHGRIVGGDKAPAGSAPWQAEILLNGDYPQDVLDADYALELKNPADPKVHFYHERPSWDRRHICGAVLLDNDWVVTAGHCLFYRDGKGKLVFDAGLLTQRVVRLGTQTLAVPDGQDWTMLGELRAIRYGIVHARYDENDPTKGYDIGLLKLDTTRHPLGGTPRYQPIALPGPRFVPDAARPMTVTGWGMTLAQAANEELRPAISAASNDPNSAILKTLNVNLVVPGQCAAELGKANPAQLATMICAVAGLDRNGQPQDQCRGDSGGPLTAPQGQSAVLVGLVSWGLGCAQMRGNTVLPGVYTSVIAQRDWILATQAWADAQGGKLDGKMLHHAPVAKRAKAENRHH